MVFTCSANIPTAHLNRKDNITESEHLTDAETHNVCFHVTEMLCWGHTMTPFIHWRRPRDTPESSRTADKGNFVCEIFTTCVPIRFRMNLYAQFIKKLHIKIGSFPLDSLEQSALITSYSQGEQPKVTSSHLLGVLTRLSHETINLPVSPQQSSVFSHQPRLA